MSPGSAKKGGGESEKNYEEGGMGECCTLHRGSPVFDGEAFGGEACSAVSECGHLCRAVPRREADRGCRMILLRISRELARLAGGVSEEELSHA